MSQPSLAKYIKKSPFLTGLLKPVANWYANAAGYRKYGLRYDDLLIDESETVQKALKRLSPEETAMRTLRYRRAFQLSIEHHVLPKEKWTKPEEDIRYLTPFVEQVAAEEAEREAFEALKIIKK
ncbi:hypothetical protein G9A89_002737 [Geosiphon pyriformis]|nr:hypothetical protein G9A89_002737 [Geosiphon pyriformis]